MNTRDNDSTAGAAACDTAGARPRRPRRLPLPDDAAQRALARGWLWLALAALIGSGLFSVLLVLARTPGINAWLPAGDFFRVALVVHVDLSVLVWFVAIAGMLWSLNSGRAAAAIAALGLLAAGAVRRSARR